mgnify:CR=1 FL=1
MLRHPGGSGQGKDCDPAHHTVTGGCAGTGGAADPGVCDPGDSPGRRRGLAADVRLDCPLQFSGRFCIIKFCF